MAKQRKFKSRQVTKKASGVKLANKHYGKLVRRGKIKPKTTSQFNRIHRKSQKQQKSDKDSLKDNEIDKENQEDVTELFSAKDLKYVKKSGFGFPANASTKRHVSQSEDEEEYEKSARTSFLQKKKVKLLLPLKTKHGLMQQSVELEENEAAVDDESAQATIPTDQQPDETMEENVDSVFKSFKTFSDGKQKIGILCSKVVENPEENIRNLKELLQLFSDRKTSVSVVLNKLVLISLLEVFKDILPSYHIRTVSEEEKDKKLKKETRQLREYEETLLRYYKQYLQKLEKVIKKYLHNCKKMKKKKQNPAFKFLEVLAVACTKCLCGLLVSHPYFNFRTNIASLVVVLLMSSNDTISTICSDALRQLYKEDKLGEASLDCVKKTKASLKSRGFNVHNRVLYTLMSLKLKEVEEKEQKKDMKKIRAELNRMSRKERRQKKKRKNLNAELLEAEAEESKDKKHHFQTEILKHVMHIYFHILKMPTKSPLLTPVLEGLSKFAHLINIEFFDDIINVLFKHVDSGELTNNEMLHCLLTVFTVLSGQGEVLNVDPQRFYSTMYALILDVHLGQKYDMKPLLACLDQMLIKRRKKVTQQRVLAYIKRLSTECLQLEADAILAVFSIIRSLFLSNKHCDILLDPDTTCGSGLFQPELPDPEHCNASSTALWELLLLRKHYHSFVCSFAVHILYGSPIQGRGQIPVELKTMSPHDIYMKFNPYRQVLEGIFDSEDSDKVDTVERKKPHFSVTNSGSLYCKASKQAASSEFNFSWMYKLT